MIYVLHGHERSKHRSTFDRMFRLRHEVFIKQRGWALPSSNGLEIDQYDTDDAVYLLDLDQDGAIRAHLRLTPASHLSLIADYFPYLVENGIDMRDAKVVEGSRWTALPLQRNKSDMRALKGTFMAAIAEWAIEQGYDHLQTMVDAAMLPFFVQMSLLTTPLGLAHPYGGGKGVHGGGECIAFRMPMTADFLKDIYAYGNLSDPRSTFRRPLPREAA